MIDNHMVSEGEKELDKKGSCPNCGNSNMDEIEYCINDNCECAQECSSYNEHIVCVMMEYRLRCPKCEVVAEAQ